MNISGCKFGAPQFTPVLSEVCVARSLVSLQCFVDHCFISNWSFKSNTAIFMAISIQTTMNRIRPDHLRPSCVAQPTGVLGCTPQRPCYLLILYPGCTIYESYFLYTIICVSNETNVQREEKSIHLHTRILFFFILKLTMQIQIKIQKGHKNVITKFRQMLSAILK